jgi:DNA-binding LacI/PurR family transcriptional regulator
MAPGSRLEPATSSATLEAVARVAGVSRATVSRVVNGGNRVAPETRQTVEGAIRRLAYVPNRAARSLVTRRTDSIGLVIPETTTTLFGDPFFARIVRGITDALRDAEMQLVLLAPQNQQDEARVGRYLTAGHVDGALLVSLHGDDPLPGLLAARGMPTVLGGRPPRGTDISYVDVDNVTGARDAVRHLLSSGRRQIAIMTGPGDMAAAADRLEGYRLALSEAGVTYAASLVASGDFRRERAYESAIALLDRRPDVDAVFAASDPMAIGVLQALRSRGRGVPGDVALVGFDDSPLAASADPPLSSVRQPIEEMGTEMTRLLLSMIASRSQVRRRVILATDLVVRASSGG